MSLTQSRVHFSSTLLDLVFGGAAAVTDASAHLLVPVGLRAVGQTVTGLPAVKTQLEEGRKEQEGGNKRRVNNRREGNKEGRDERKETRKGNQEYDKNV